MKIKRSKTINSNSEIIWPMLSDFANICDYHPMIKRSYTKLVPNSRKIGAIRHCDLNRGKYIEEKLIEYEEGSHYVAELYDSNFPLKAGDTTFKLERLSNNSSKVTISVDMMTEYVILKPVMYLMLRFFALPGILKNIKKAAEEKGKELIEMDADLSKSI